MNKTKRLEILKRLRENNPKPETELNWNSPFDMNYLTDVQKWVAPKSIRVLDDASAKQLAKIIKEAKGTFNDDEDAVKNVFGKKNYIAKFKNTKKTSPPKLQVGTYNIKGIESDQDYFENNKEDAFYFSNAITMNAYTNILEKYPNINEEVFLSNFGTDLIIMPDGKNKFYIELIEEINDGEFLIKGNFQLKLMKYPSKEEFIFSSQFITEYNYDYYSGS